MVDAPEGFRVVLGCGNVHDLWVAATGATGDRQLTMESRTW